MQFGSISPHKLQQLSQAMQRLAIRESDFEERFIRAGGPGGQRVNKVSTCVVLRHRPSGIEVRCQRERSQVLNRFLARRLLLAKLEAIRLGKLSEEARRVAKLRKQKQRRSRRSKAKMRRIKQVRTKKKSLRGPIRTSELD